MTMYYYSGLLRIGFCHSRKEQLLLSQKTKNASSTREIRIDAGILRMSRAKSSYLCSIWSCFQSGVVNDSV